MADQEKLQPVIEYLQKGVIMVAQPGHRPSARSTPEPYTTADAGEDLLRAGELLDGMRLISGPQQPLPDELTPRRPGRPRGKKWDRPITFIADQALEEALNARAAAEHRSRSSLIRHLVERGLDTD
ncbi:hypothetical protein AB0E55_07635 [Amycolatopsis keratiniphila]|uniref:hypothetical protein n=1 Tax=Amycolatopsis keratiniphila TaxID=129921 RepID=UPI0033EADED9